GRLDLRFSRVDVESFRQDLGGQAQQPPLPLGEWCRGRLSIRSHSDNGGGTLRGSQKGAEVSPVKAVYFSRVTVDRPFDGVAELSAVALGERLDTERLDRLV